MIHTPEVVWTLVELLSIEEERAEQQDFREEDYALAVDAIVAEVQMRDGSVRFEHVAERLDTGNVFPDCHNLGAGTLKNRWIGF